MKSVRYGYLSPANIVRGVGECDESASVDGPPVTITHDHLQIGEVVLPGAWIENGTVVVRPGRAEITPDGIDLNEPSRLTVTFLVGDINVVGDAVDCVDVRQRVGDTIPRALDPLDGIPGETGTLNDELLRVTPDPGTQEALQAAMAVPSASQLTTYRDDPRLSHGADTEPAGPAEAYLILSEEERAKGFVRPVRRTYIHKRGISQQKPACGVATTMSLPLAETYARQPDFYGATYCCGCRMHLPVNEFDWEDGTQVGS